MHLTTKQIELLRVISGGVDNQADLDEILEGVRYETSKQSLQFSIRALIKKELIVKLGISKRRGRKRQVIGMTPLGMALAGVKPATPVELSVLATEEEDQLDTDFGMLP